MNPPQIDTNVQLKLDEVVQRVQNLPSLPIVLAELLSSLDTENIDIAMLAKKVSHDQALAAKTLRFANSSLYGTQARVTTIQQAITLLGVQNVRRLITTAALTASLPDSGCPQFDQQAFWSHSMATAVCAGVLARHLHVNQEYAYTAGLLHDIGRLVLASCFSEPYEQVLAYRIQHDCHLLDAERAVLGTDHTVAGTVLAQHWNFSEIMKNAISAHHEPTLPGHSSLASIVHVADAIAHALDLGGVEDDLVPYVALPAWESLNFSEATYLRMFREAELQFEEISRAL